MSRPPLHAVIPAGGAGTRLWPLSRAGSPKFLHDLTGAGRSLLQATVDRLHPLTGDRVMVVTGERHVTAVTEQLARPGAGLGAGVGAGAGAEVIAEPDGRDSMAAIGLAAALIEARDPEAVVGSFPADHVITDPDTFRTLVGLAVDVAEDGLLVTLGIEPTHASTAFGYIHQGSPLTGRPGAYAVRSFVEKPPEEVAEQYVASGDYRWNAGMFVCRAYLLLDLLADSHPEFAATLRRIAADPARLAELWPTLPRIAIDHAVAEPAAAAGRVAVVPGAFGWDDVGDFASLATLLAAGRAGARDAGASGPVVLGDPDRVVCVDASGLVVTADRPIAVVGVHDVVVVDTGDALLVTTSAHAQRVKDVVERIKETHPGLL